MSTETLGHLIEHVGGSIKTGPFGTTLKADEYSETGVPIISVGEVGYGSLSLRGDTPRAPIEVTKRLPEYLLKTGDIVFGRKGAVDRSAWVKESENGWFLGSDGIRLRLPSSVDSRFVAYQFQSEATKTWLLQHASGSTMLSLNQKILARVPLLLPPLPEQHAIAEVLGALDDKIAANTKLAATLTGLLDAQFEQLGVNSEPEDDSQIVSLDELIELNPKVAVLNEAEPVYVDMQKLPTTGMSISGWERRPAKGGARFMNDDTLLARITPCLENRKTGYVDFLHDGQAAIGSTEFIVMRSRPGIPKQLSYFVATSERFRTYAIRHMVGTSGRQRVSALDLAGYTLSKPDPDALARFGEISTAHFTLVKSLTDENRTLSATRDALLPQLMSGELLVKRGEKVLEEAGV